MTQKLKTKGTIFHREFKVVKRYIPDKYKDELINNFIITDQYHNWYAFNGCCLLCGCRKYIAQYHSFSKFPYVSASFDYFKDFKTRKAVIQKSMDLCFDCDVKMIIAKRDWIW